MSYPRTQRWAGHRTVTVRVWGQRPPGGPLRTLLRTLWERHERRMYLGAVVALGERTMLDLGFDPDAVRAEAAKPFWRT